MTSLILSKFKSPEQEELEEKQRIADEQESIFSKYELEYSTLASEIGAFRNRYYLRVGVLYARLDLIRAEIRELFSKNKPDDATAIQEAEDAREQSNKTWEEVNGASEDDETAFKPSADLKQIYRQAAMLIHPDRATDEEDRKLRDHLMTEINLAYSKGNDEAIAEIIERYRDRLSAVSSDDIGVQLVRLIRCISRTRERIAHLVKAISELEQSDWAKLKADVDEAEANGEDLLGNLAEKVHADILEEQTRLKELLPNPTQDDTRNAYPSFTNKDSAENAVPTQAPDFRPEGLIHRTDRGEKVRSKSEVIIANTLHNLGLDYRYEFPLEGSIQAGVRRPDFVVFDMQHRPILWEHLGMLHDDRYSKKWNEKLVWYEANGFIIEENLFLTRDEADGSLDSQSIRKTALLIQSKVNQKL